MSQVVLNTHQLECLSSPVRSEVFGRLRLLKTATVREVAESIHRKPQAIHYHMKELVNAGLAVEVERRPGLRKPESVYAAIQGSISLPKDRDPEVARLRSKAVATGLRQTLRGFAQAVQDEQGDARPFHVLRMNVQLSPEDARQFLDLLEQASRFADAHKSEECQALAWHSIVYPLRKTGSEPL